MNSHCGPVGPTYVPSGQSIALWVHTDCAGALACSPPVSLNALENVKAEMVAVGLPGAQYPKQDWGGVKSAARMR